MFKRKIVSYSNQLYSKNDCTPLKPRKSTNAGKTKHNKLITNSDAVVFWTRQTEGSLHLRVQRDHLQGQRSLCTGSAQIWNDSQSLITADQECFHFQQSWKLQRLQWIFVHSWTTSYKTEGLMRYAHNEKFLSQGLSMMQLLTLDGCWAGK